MKNKGRIYIIFIFLFFISCLFGERIKEFNVIVQINNDSSLTVDETIYYDFDSYKHGIFVDIPIKSRDNEIKLNFIKKNGENEIYEVFKSYDGVRYRIGKFYEYTALGTNVYELSYTMENAVIKEKGLSRVYFNAIGQFWNVPINKASVTIKYADGREIPENEIRNLEIYTGKFGDKGNNYRILKNAGEIVIETKEELPVENGLTFILDLKNDSVRGKREESVRNLNRIINITGIFSILFVSLYSALTWYLFGKDPKRKSIVPEFNVPNNISAMFMAYIEGERDSIKILEIGILSLISKGYVNVKGGKGKNKKYTLNIQNRNNLKLRKATLFEEENNLLNILSPNDLFEKKELIYKYTNNILDYFEKKYNKIIYRKNYKYFIPFIIGTAIPLIFIILKIMGGKLYVPEEIIYAIIFTIVIFRWLKAVYEMPKGRLKILFIAVVVGGIIGIVMFADIYSGLIILTLGLIFLVYEKLIGRYTVSGLRKTEYIKGFYIFIAGNCFLNEDLGSNLC